MSLLPFIAHTRNTSSIRTQTRFQFANGLCATLDHFHSSGSEPETFHVYTHGDEGSASAFAKRQTRKDAMRWLEQHISYCNEPTFVQ
jgi:hypothetical protein